MHFGWMGRGCPRQRGTGVHYARRRSPRSSAPMTSRSSAPLRCIGRRHRCSAPSRDECFVLVAAEVGVGEEALVTQLAMERPLPVVAPQVLLEVGVLLELFP